LSFWLIYVKSCVDSSVVELLSSAFAKVFGVDNLFNSPLLIVLVFIFIVTNELIDEVSQLLVLVGLAAQQIRDVVTGRAQASHE